MSWVTASPWVYPSLEVVHILGIALLLGSLVVFELRVWGLGLALDPKALARLALPVAVGGFGLAAASGAVMFFSQVDEMLGNRAFQIKMALLLAAGGNAVAFHWRGGLAAEDATARLQTALSLGLWIAIAVCGRWIAYK